MVHAFDHLAPHRILVVEEAGVVEADEELAVGAVRALRPRHRGDAADMRHARKFRLEVRLVRAPRAGPGRIAALRHEAGDDAVEDDAVVKAFLDELADARDVAGRDVRAEADDDVAAGVEGENESVHFIGHDGKSPVCRLRQIGLPPGARHPLPQLDRSGATA